MSDDEAFLDLLFIPLLRRAGDLRTAGSLRERLAIAFGPP